jgi:hypothetical protein
MSDTLLRLRGIATVELVPDRTARRVIAVAAFALALPATRAETPLPAATLASLKSHSGSFTTRCALERCRGQQSVDGG